MDILSRAQITTFAQDLIFFYLCDYEFELRKKINSITFLDILSDELVLPVLEAYSRLNIVVF